jgi:hypothetical protein
LNSKSTSNMFDNCDSVLRICINENEINSQISSFKKNCSDDCFANDSVNKLITKKKNV